VGAVAAAGQLVAVGASAGDLSLIGYSSLRLWRVTDGTLLWERPHTQAEYIKFSPDGTLLVTADSNGTKLRRVEDGMSVWYSERDSDHVVFSPDGSLLASEFNTVSFWHFPAMTPAPIIDDVRAPIAFSPDGALLASRLSSYYTEIHGLKHTQVGIWRIADGALLHSLEWPVGCGEKTRLHSLAFSTDGALLAAGGNDSTSHIWRVPDGDLLQTIHHTGITSSHQDITGMTFLSEDTLILGTTTGGISIWQVQP